MSPERRVGAQCLFKRTRHQVAIGPQPFHRSWMLIQAQDGIANQVGRGLVACNQQQHAEPHQFLVREALPIHFRLQQRAHQVVLGMPL